MKRNFKKKLTTKVGVGFGLTEAERDKMRFVLSEYAAMRPIREPLVAMKVFRSSAWHSFLRRPIGITAAALLLMLSFGGVAYASEGTLPGSTLYPVKVDIIEPLQLALATSPRARASLLMTFAERRINEAASLAQSGKLGVVEETKLAGNFTKNAEAAIVATTQEHSPLSTDLLSENFAAHLTAYESVLALVGKHSPGTSVTAHFQAAIQKQIALLARAERSDEAAQTTSSQGFSTAEQSAVANQNVLQLQHAATVALGVSANIVDAASNTLDASSSANARSALLQASSLAEQGSVLLRRHDENGASLAFHDALSATARLDVLAHAAVALKIPVLATFELSSTTVMHMQPETFSNYQKSTAQRTSSVHKSVLPTRGF